MMAAKIKIIPVVKNALKSFKGGTNPNLKNRNVAKTVFVSRGM